MSSPYDASHLPENDWRTGEEVSIEANTEKSMYFSKRENNYLGNVEEFKSNLTGHNSKDKSNDIRQRVIKICEDWEIPLCRVEKVIKILMQDNTINLPNIAPRKWMERTEEDPQNPLEFLKV